MSSNNCSNPYAGASKVLVAPWSILTNQWTYILSNEWAELNKPALSAS
jgi:hypothetical protein